jgi:CheY-like chemotaxis protein
VGEISSSLLRLARKRKNTPAAVSLVEVVQSCARIAANELRHRARYVEELGELPLVSAIESELAQIVLNLLLNAAQAIAPGATNQNSVRVAGGVDADGEFAWIEVSDTGSGIPRANLGRIFDPFFTTKDVGKGSGLGLAVSYSLAQAMGGDLTVESEVGRGTTFRLKLPVAQHASDEPPATRRPSLAKQRVLVVDDTEPVARSIAALLRDHEVQITSSGAQALEHLERGRFDVVISDVMMPQMTGIELFERAIEVRAELARRWIFVTGGTLTEDIDAALERIGAPIVTKPIARSDLLEAVASRVRAA